MDLKLKGKRALVMGASMGIGKAVAESLIAEGATVAINARNEQRLNDCASEIGAAAALAADLSESGAAKKLIDRTIAELGGVDILVTNTGGPKKGNFSDIDDAQWQHDFQSVWMSVVEAMRAALPGMQENKYGRVLLVTSIAAKEPLPGLTTSNGLRAGLAGLVRSIASEVAADGVTLNLLLPGYTNTTRLQALDLSEEWIREKVPAGRLGEPSELASLAAFLASPLAGYITGQQIAIDGGVLRGIG